MQPKKGPHRIRPTNKVKANLKPKEAKTRKDSRKRIYPNSETKDAVMEENEKPKSTTTQNTHPSPKTISTPNQPELNKEQKPYL